MLLTATLNKLYRYIYKEKKNVLCCVFSERELKANEVCSASFHFSTAFSLSLFRPIPWYDSCLPALHKRVSR